MPGRIGMKSHIHHINEVFLVGAIVVAFNEAFLLLEGHLNVGIRKIAIEVQVYDPGVSGVVFRFFPDKAPESLHGSVLAHSLAIIERYGRKDAFVYGAKSPVQVMVDNPRFHGCGEDFAGFRRENDEGIVRICGKLTGIDFSL
jgi:hypothetical protein